MKKIGIGIDFSNICRDYNTVYLDRDNTDPKTSKCMKAVLTWTNDFISELLENFGYEMHTLNSSTLVKIDEIASKRFLFYSLEKEILMQSFLLQKEYVQYENTAAWAMTDDDSILIQNDADGGGIYFFLNENSRAHQWITDKLQDFALDEVDFEAK